MFNHRGYTVDSVTIDYSGRYPEMTIHCRKGSQQKTIKWVSPIGSTLRSLQRDIKAIIDDDMGAK
jgi:hypothetical protein